MSSPRDTPLRRRSARRTVAATTLAAASVVALAVPAGGAGASPASTSVRTQAAPGGSMTRQLPQDITVAVRGRTVRIHFGSLRRRATRTATIRFTRSGAAAIVRSSPAAGSLRLTAPKGSRRVRVSVPRTQEWTATSITRSIRR